MPNENIIDNDLKNYEEYGMDMLYDNALDDGPMLIDNPHCLVVTALCEDKNDILAACDNTLTHESPTLFLNSPIHTMEEKPVGAGIDVVLELPTESNPEFGGDSSITKDEIEDLTGDSHVDPLDYGENILDPLCASAIMCPQFRITPRTNASSTRQLRTMTR